MAAHQAPRPWDSPGKNTGVGCHFLLQCMKVKSESEVTQSCPTPSDPMDCSPPGSSVHGIFQARVLEWGAIAFSKKVSSSLLKQKKPELRLKKNSYSKKSPLLEQQLQQTSLVKPGEFSTFEPSKCPWETIPEHLYQSTPLPPYNKSHEPSLGWK